MSISFTFAADFTVTGTFPSNNWVNNNADYKMSEIGTTGIFYLEKILPVGTYEYKVFNTGTWTGPDGSGDNRVFTLATQATVKFYAKLDGTTIRFFCDAQQFYVIGDVVGGWDISNKKPMTNSATNAVYSANLLTGDYKIVSLDKNSAIVWNDITPSNQTLGSSGNYNLVLDFATFAITAQSITTKLNDNFIFSTIFSGNGNIKVHFDGVAQIELYTVTGQLIRSSSVTNEFIQSVKNGLYLLRINGQTKKIMVQ
jgi:hypothetical protein